MSFTNCPELSLTFWRSMNDVPGRQLAAAAPYLSSPAAAPAATVATGAAAAAPLATAAAAPLSPPSRDDGVHFVGVALSAAAAIDVARPPEGPTEGPTAAAAGSSGGGGEWRSPLALATTEVRRRRPQSPQPRPPRIATSTSDLATTGLPLRPRHVGGHRPLRPQRAEDAPPRGAHQALQSGLHDGKRFRSLASD